jgi:putative DNA primase/helicase
MRVLPFVRSFSETEQDHTLGDQLKAEGSGIHLWAVEGCLKWQNDGLGKPASVRNATQEYRADTDPLAGFLRTCCIELPAATAQAHDLFVAYQKYGDEQQIPPRDRLKQTTFGKRLTQRGFEKSRTERGNVYRGIGLVISEP